MSPGGQYFDNTPYRYELDPITLERTTDANGDFIEVSNYSSIRNNWLSQNIGSLSTVTGSWPASVTNWNQLRANWDDAYADDLVTYHPEYDWYNFRCEMTSVDISEQCEVLGQPYPLTLNLAASREFDAWLRSVSTNCEASWASSTIGGTAINNVNLFYPLGEYSITPTTSTDYDQPSPTYGVARGFMDPTQVSCTTSVASAAIIDPLVPSGYVDGSIFMAFMRSRLMEMVDMSQQPSNNFSASIYYVLFNPEGFTLPASPYTNPTPLEGLKNVMWSYENQLSSKTEFELFRDQYLYWKQVYLRYIFETYVASTNPVWALDIDDDGYYGETYDIYNNLSFEYEVDRYKLLYRQDLQEEAIIQSIGNFDVVSEEHCTTWFNIPMGLSSAAANNVVATLQGHESFSRCAEQADAWLEAILDDPCFDAQGLTGTDLDAYKRALRFKMIEICSEGSYVGYYADGAGGTEFVNNLYGHSDPNDAPWNQYTNPSNPQEQGPYAATPYVSAFEYIKPNLSQISYSVSSIDDLIGGLGQTGCTMSTSISYNGDDIQQQILSLFDVDATGDCTCNSLLAGIQGANPSTPGLVWSSADPNVTDLEGNLPLVTGFLNAAPYSLGVSTPYAERVVRFCAKTGYENLADVDGTATTIFPHELECESCKCDNLWGVIENQLPAINASCSTSVTLDNTAADRGWSQFGSCVQSAIANELNTLFGLGSANPLTIVNGWITTCANSTDQEAFTDFPEDLRCLDNGIIEINPCSTDIREQDLINAIVDYEERAAEYLEDARNEYLTQAWHKIAKREYLTLSYELNEYYYTLYVYDQADNLVKTVPPEGVKPLDLAETLNLGAPASNNSFEVHGQLTSFISGNFTVDNAINRLRSNHETLRVLPKHTMETRYHYNSMNQVYEQRTPDGGVTRFWYNDLEQLVASQNAVQSAPPQPANKRHSYTIYDNLNRPIETGVLVGATAMNNVTARSAVNYAGWFGTHTKEEVTRTIYDEVPGYLSPIQSSQNFTANNTRNRVAAVLYYDVYDASQQDGYQSAYHYSYDVHGNVNDLLSEDNNGVPALRFKRVQYDYDVLSGNVNEVHFQPGSEDEFYHRYSYDDNNRLQKVETSQDYLTWGVEARYFYYPHGPLRRVEVGNKHVQATDYAYTLQGWIKGVNSAVAKPQYDIGSDGLPNTLQPNMRFGFDAGGYTLGYYDDQVSGLKDYLAIGGAAAVEFDMQDYINSTITDLSQVMHVNNTFNLTNNAYASLYNGNISRMTTSNTDNLQLRMGTTVSAYRYDQANRIKGAKDVNLLETSGNLDGFGQVNNFATAMSNYFASSGGSMSTLSGEYEVEYAYDKNGNLSSLERQGNEVSGNTAMDGLEYGYFPGTNRLEIVEDAVGGSAHAGSIQGDITYGYDEIGNLTSETYTINPGTNNLDITWTASGKVKEVTKSAQTTTFHYDPLGNRIGKTVTPTGGSGTYTRYARDASGNTLVTYEADLGGGGEGGALAEWEIYGSSRLGTLTAKNAELGQEYGNKRYEFSNHLGNVLHTYTDHLIHNYQTLASHDLETNNPLTLDYEFPIGLITQSVNGGMQVDFQSTTTGFGNYVPNAIVPKAVYKVSGNVIQGESYRILIDYSTTNPGSSSAPGIASLSLIAKQGSTVWETTYISAPTQGTASLIFVAPVSGPLTIDIEMVPLYNISESGPKGSTDYQINTQAGTAVLSNLLIQSLVGGGYAADIQQASMYYPFGSLQPNRHHVGPEDYRYGFNGMEKDNEIKGNANSLDFGARVYDPRVGRWLSVDPLYNLQPGWSTYKFAKDNPLIYIDPEGKTEFYFRGKYVGSDGVNNGVIGIVKDKGVADNINEARKNKQDYKIPGMGHNQDIGGVFGVHIDVLRESVHTLSRAMSIEGETREFTSVLKMEQDGFSVVQRGKGPVGDFGGNFTGNNLPPGDVSIHSHPTGTDIDPVTGKVRSADASKPTGDKYNSGDKTDVFPNYDMNIIVGKNGDPSYQRIRDANGNETVEPLDVRVGAINFFDKKGDSKASITGRQADKILKKEAKRAKKTKKAK